VRNKRKTGIALVNDEVINQQTFRHTKRYRFRRSPPSTDRIIIRTLLEWLPQVLKNGVFFVRAEAIDDKELPAQVQCFSLHCGGGKRSLKA
jgi:hypothetical protein